jgi:outer membrane protein TolC
VAQAQRARDDSVKAFEDAMRLIESLGRDLPLAPQRVEPMRDALRSSAQAAGTVTPSIRELIAADAPLSQAQIDEVKAHLRSRIAYWEWEIERRQGLRVQLERGGA